MSNPATQATSPEMMEAARLRVLRDYDVLDSAPEPNLDRITKLVAELTQMPISLVSLVDNDRLYFKSNHGMGDIRSIARANSMCEAAILQKGVYEVSDVRKDTKHCVCYAVSTLGAVFYAGAPIVSTEGYHLGTLCVLDTVPRTMNDQHRRILSEMTAVVAQMLSLERSLKSSAHKLGVAIEGSREAWVVTDQEELNLEASNQAARELLGLSADQPVQLSSLCDEGSLESLYDELDRLLLHPEITSKIRLPMTLAKGKIQEVTLEMRAVVGQSAATRYLMRITPDRLLN